VKHSTNLLAWRVAELRVFSGPPTHSVGGPDYM